MSMLYLVRHGPTHAKGMVGWTDLPADLSDTAALSRLSDWLPQTARIVSSDLSRAMCTADAIAGGRVRLPNNAAFREINFGTWEMKTWSEISAVDPERIRAFYETPGQISAPDGDSWDSLCARVDPAVDDLLAEGDLIVVCHFGVVLSQVQRATGQSAYDTFAHKIDNLSVTQIEVGPIWRAKVINHIP